MQWLAAVGGGSFVLASLGVGVRLLLLARRTRKLPELLLGLGLLLMGGISYPLTATAHAATGLTECTRVALVVTSHLLNVVGISALGVFIWRTYHPHSRAARLGAFAIGATAAISVLWQGITPGFAAGALRNEGAGLLALTVVPLVALAWATASSLRYALQLRRREALGLAEPHLRRIVGRWAVSTGAAGAISLFSIGLQLQGIDPATSTAGGLVIGVFGGVASVQLARAFFARDVRAPSAAAA